MYYPQQHQSRWGSPPTFQHFSSFPDNLLELGMMKTLILRTLVIGFYFGTSAAGIFEPFLSSLLKRNSSENRYNNNFNGGESRYRYTAGEEGTTTQGSHRKIYTTSDSHFTDSLRKISDFRKYRERENERYTTERYKLFEDKDFYPGKVKLSSKRDQESSSKDSDLKTSYSREPYESGKLEDSQENSDGYRMRLAEKWCSRYEKKCQTASSFGNVLTTRIVGGHPSRPKEHPHMVMIGYGSEREKQWLCGGSLLSARYILSAAHCANTMKLGPARWALLGDLDISTNDDNSRPQEREIIERILHPKYRDTTAYHDIALFKTESDVVFNSWVYPTCLHVGRSISPSVATITGWGRTDFVSETSPKLLEADVRVFDEVYCNTTINKAAGSKMPRGYDSNTMVCAGEKTGGKDACQGDSGGPLVISENGGCIKRQIGITSIGSECGLPDSPGVYTRVSEYVSWIEEIVWS